jgi:threonine aldolase
MQLMYGVLLCCTDPTVRQLEAMAAEQFGKEAGLFVPRYDLTSVLLSQ